MKKNNSKNTKNLQNEFFSDYFLYKRRPLKKTKYYLGMNKYVLYIFWF